MNPVMSYIREFYEFCMASACRKAMILVFLIMGLIALSGIIVASIENESYTETSRFEGQEIHRSGDTYGVRVKNINPRKLLALQDYLEEGRGECELLTVVDGMSFSALRTVMYKCEE